MNLLLRTSLVLLAVVALGGVVVAQTWNKGTGNYSWTDSNNWTPGTVPGVGDTAQFGRIDWAKPIAIDMKGSSYNFEKIQGNYNGSVEIFYDSDFLTPNANPLGTNNSVATRENFSYAGYGSLVEAANASPLLTVNDLSINKEHSPVFYMPLKINDELWAPEHATIDFYGDVQAGRITETRNDGWVSTLNFHSDLTVDTTLFNPHRGGSGQTINVSGLATIDEFIGEGAIANFNDLHVNTLRQANESEVNISGRYSGNTTYVRDANVSGETRTPSINLLSGSTLAPGDSIGTLGGTALDVNVNGGSTYEWEVGASPSTSTPGVGWDLSLANTFNIDGPVDFQIVESGLTESISPTDEFPVLAANSFDLADLDPTTDINVSVVADQATWDVSGAQFSLVPDFGDLDGDSSNGNEDAIVLSGISASIGAAVPEPASIALWSLLGLALAGFGIYRRRRSK